MAMRLRLLQGATALLYMGPLIAGLAGFGWAMLLPFVSVFVLWLMLLRPHQWPQSNREWLQASAWIAALTQILTQVLLVAVLFGIGRGIGGVMGQVPLVFPMLPLALSFTAIPLARLAWDSDQALAKGLSIDELLYPHKQPQPTLHPAPTPEVVVEPLFAFPDNAPLANLGPALEEALEDAGAWAVLAVVADRLDAAPGRHACLREALLIWATDPGNFASNAAPAGMRAAFRVAGSDLRLLQILLPRAAALARIMPERHAQFPDRADLETLARLALPAQLATDHAALMAALGCRAGSQPLRRATAAVHAGVQAT